ncbi:unnamed protein product, partial [Cylicostephanus goldi]
MLSRRLGSSARQLRKVSTYTGFTSEQFMKQPANEPILEYKKGSSERAELEKELELLSKEPTIVPVRIGKKSITGKLDRKQVM